MSSTRRSRPALDGHDDAAAEAEFGTGEFGIIEETVTRNGQGRPKLVIVVAYEVLSVTRNILPNTAEPALCPSWPEAEPAIGADGDEGAQL